MSLVTWHTRDPLDPGFERAWRARLAGAPHAHFGFDPAYLAWSAAHGAAARALLVDEDGRGAALVLREEKGGLACGWPWRSGAVVEDPARALPEGLTPAECGWLFACAERAAEGARLRCFLPGPPQGAGWAAGLTSIVRLERAEAELMQDLDASKRRALKKAQRSGWEVVEAVRPAEWNAFAGLQRATESRRGAAPAALPEHPAPGESWREWELPWMWLLVAVKDGVVEAGSGFGFLPGGTLDYRTNASTEAAKKEGVNVLLGWEAMRRGRERGLRWLNWGGATRFKRDFGGPCVEISCRLGGGAAWAIANRVAASLQRARPRIAGAVRKLRQGRGAS
ncbi:MAG: GNAT family N-acetyltransferase [Candidatus Eisenbacteria bacterium]|nr:GNAT family N-acetyltransferase [Candidatus Eisenbacteria bacterium]